MARKPANPQNIRQQATVLLATYLDVSGIPYIPARGSPDLIVQHRAGGTDVDVTVAPGGAPTAVRRASHFSSPSGSWVRHRVEAVVPSPAFGSGATPEETRAAFHFVTDLAGWGRPAVLDRGCKPTRLTASGSTTHGLYREHDDLVIFRHNALRRVPNPPAEVYRRFERVVRRAARKFYWANAKLCQVFGWDVEDLQSYAQVWTTIFWSTGRTLEPGPMENENLLYRYLRQRFAELHGQLKGKRIRSSVPDAQVAAIGTDTEAVKLLREDQHGALKVEWVAVRPPPSPRSDPGKVELDLSSPKARRDSAVSLLERLLGQMPHEALVDALARASESDFTCPDTRQEAAKRLRLHRSACASCAAESRAGEVDLSREGESDAGVRRRPPRGGGERGRDLLEGAGPEVLSVGRGLDDPRPEV